MESEKSKVCCFSGHRNIPYNDIPKLKRQLKNTVDTLADEGILYFGVGGAVGFDTMAAEAVLAKRRENPDIKLIVVAPCATQSASWSRQDAEKYEEIKHNCDKFVCLCDAYYPGCMQARNRHLIDNSSVLVSYLRKQSGGTYYTVNYAKEKNLKIIELSELSSEVQHFS